MPTGINPAPPSPPSDDDASEEIDVTELIERIENLEKEISGQKEVSANLQTRVSDLEESLDVLAEGNA